VRNSEGENGGENDERIPNEEGEITRENEQGSGLVDLNNAGGVQNPSSFVGRCGEIFNITRRARGKKTGESKKIRPENQVGVLKKVRKNQEASLLLSAGKKESLLQKTEERRRGKDQE